MQKGLELVLSETVERQGFDFFVVTEATWAVSLQHGECRERKCEVILVTVIRLPAIECIGESKRFGKAYEPESVCKLRDHSFLVKKQQTREVVDYSICSGLRKN